MDSSIIDRLKGRTVEDPVSGCWVYAGCVRSDGYRQVVWNGKEWYIHRISYTLFKGPIPDGFEVDHLCRNRTCWNPEHLEAVTPRVNTLRSEACSALNASKTHCPQGHEYTPENTYIGRSKKRACRKCQTIHNAAFKARQPAEWNRARMDRKNLAQRLRRAHPNEQDRARRDRENQAQQLRRAKKRAEGNE